MEESFLDPDAVAKIKSSVEEKVLLDPWKAATCSSCKNFCPLSDRERIAMGGINAPVVGDCRAVPPVPVVAGMQRLPNGQQQPALMMVYPRVPGTHPACSLHVSQTP